MTKQRIGYIDNAKGLLILLVVMGHIFLEGPVHDFIYAFHMCAFFIITGMLFHYATTLSKSIASVVKTKLFMLLIPFLFFEVIGVLTDIFRRGITLNVFGYLYNTLSGNYNTGPNWFLVATFIAEMLFVILYKAIRNPFGHGICVGLIAACFIGVPDLFPNAGCAGVGLVCIAFGYYACRLLETDRPLFAAFALAAVWGISCVNGSVDILQWRFGKIPLFCIGAIAGTYFILSAAKRISSKRLTYIGKNTLIVMGTHQAILLCIGKYVSVDTASVPKRIVLFLVTVLLEFPVIFIFRKYLPFLVGKKHP